MMEIVKNLGKLLNVGETFYSTTKRMSPKREQFAHRNDRWEILRQGDKRMFEKGKRKYYCEVLGLVETRTGYHRGSIWEPKNNLNHRISGRRWYMFTYLVKIIES